jgi:hypothetical protein
VGFFGIDAISDNECMKVNEQHHDFGLERDGAAIVGDVAASVAASAGHGIAAIPIGLIAEPRNENVAGAVSFAPGPVYRRPTNGPLVNAELGHFSLLLRSGLR